MATTPQQLGDYIFKANPYTRKKNPTDPNPSAMDPMLTETEKEYQTVVWKFKEASYRVPWSLRIPYCFTDENGQTVREYLLIGYEGSGGQ